MKILKTVLFFLESAKTLREDDLKSLVKVIQQHSLSTKIDERRAHPSFEGYHHTEKVEAPHNFKATIQRLTKNLYTKKKLME